MIGGVYYNAPAGFSSQIELFNNATDGSALHVYRAWVATDASGLYWMTRQQGTLGGTPVPSYPIVSNAAALAGLINYANGPEFDWLIPGPLAVPGYIAADNEAGSLDKWDAPGPICILMPGYSLRVFLPCPHNTAEGIGAATFYWAVLHDPG
jgi:hypothetical protein